MKKLLAAALIATGLLALPATAHRDPEIAGYVQVDGGRIWYRINGSQFLGKRPAIIAMHGGPGGTHRRLMPYVALSDSYPVILYDQLDTGNSDHPGDKGNWTVAHYLDEIDKLRAALKLDEVIIAGHSWGGSLAADYASRGHKGVKAVILSSPLISTHQWLADNEKWVDALPADVAATIRKHEAAGTTDSEEYKAAADIFYSRHMCRQSPCPGAGYTADGPKGNGILYEYMWGPSEFFAPGVLKDYDISGQLGAIDAPTLMTCGEFDEAVPESCRRYAGMIKDAQVVISPDAGHSHLVEREASYIASIRAFLKAKLGY